LLLADAIQRGEVTADTNVGALLPLGGGPIADVTLAELASHRSGLSAQGMQVEETIPFALRYLTHRDPFVHDVDGVLAIARTATNLPVHAFTGYSAAGVAEAPWPPTAGHPPALRDRPRPTWSATRGRCSTALHLASMR
jgi:CubicO group peptidase (beta-lactamase class C family)